MRQPLLVFQSRALEDRFRKAMTSKHETGGWLFVSSIRSSIVEYNKVNALFGTFADTILGWQIVPNESKHPEREYTTSHYAIGEIIAKESARSMGCIAYSFHSHPTGRDNSPSVADGVFAVQRCPIWENTGETVIVQTAPLRVNYFLVQQEANKLIYTKGLFLSWRSPKMQQILSEDRR